MLLAVANVTVELNGGTRMRLHINDDILHSSNEDPRGMYYKVRKHISQQGTPRCIGLWSLFDPPN